MVCIGSKERTWNNLRPLILYNKDSEDVCLYWEPFAGGMNCITNVPSDIPRIASDIDVFLIALWNGLKRGWTIPEKLCSKDEYDKAREINTAFINSIKRNDGLFDGVLSDRDIFEIACWRHLGGYSSRPFEGYVGNYKERDFYDERRRNIIRQLSCCENIEDIMFVSGDYKSVYINVIHPILKLAGKRMIVYCDPPQRFTKLARNYEKDFNSDEFWNWVTALRADGHYVYISECEAPSGFIPIYTNRRVVGMQINVKQKQGITENLYI